MATLSPEAQEIIQSFRRRDSQEQFKRLVASVRSKERLIEQAGETPPEEEKGGFFQTLGNILDFAGKPTRGFIQSAITGDSYFRENPMFTGEFLRDTDALGFGQTLRDIFNLEEGSRTAAITRGVTGFIGDVATDPLVYSTMGAGALPKIGHAFVTKKAVPVASDILKGKKSGTAKELYEALVTKETGAMFNKKLAGIIDKADDAAREGLMLRAKKEASEEVSKRFSQADTFLKDFKKQKLVDKHAKELGLDIKAAEELNQKLIRAVHDLKIVDYGTKVTPQQAEALLTPMFAKPALRIRSLFRPNDRPSSFTFPLLNSPTTDIPLVTKASERLFEAINGKMFTANLKIGRAVKMALDSAKESGGAMKLMADIVDGSLKLPNKIGRILSQRVLAGNQKKKEVIDQFHVSTAGLHAEVIADRDTLFRNVTSDELKQVGDIFSEFLSNKVIAAKAATQQANRSARQAARAAGTKVKKKDLQKFDFKKVELSPEDVTALHGIIRTRMPERADDAIDALETARRFFDETFKEGVQNNLLTETQRISSYMPLVTTSKTTAANVKLEDMLKASNADVMPFTLKRTYETLEQAKAAGYQVETNLGNLVAARMYQQRKAIIEKDFMERMSYEFGMSADGYAQLRKLVNDSNKNTSLAAMRVAKARGFDLKPDARDLDPSNFGVLRTSKGNLLDEKTYEALHRGYLAGDTFASREAANLGLDFAGGNVGLESVKEAQGLWEGVSAKIVTLGRQGENLTSRATAFELDKKFMSKFAPALSKSERQFFSQAIPETLHNAINESLYRRNLIREATKSWRRAGMPALADVADNFYNGYTGFVRWLKYGVTIPWPAYQARNLMGAQFMGVESASVLGEALSPFNWGRNIGVVHRGKDLVRNDGKVISNKEIMRDLSDVFEAAVPNYEQMIDVYGAMGDMLRGAYLAKAPRDATILSKAFKPITKTFEGINWFSRKLESAGRTDLYLNLRRRGFDHASAGQEMLKTMVNYGRGKTAFERDILNNVFFFYSFARTETSNTLKAMFTNPGRISTQLHAINGVKEMLMDETNWDMLPPVEDWIATNRKDAMFSKVVGVSKAGLPEVMLGIGAPIEETFQFVNPVNPTEFSISGLAKATSDSARKTAHTLIASTNPILKTAAEWASGKNFFFDRPLTDRSLRKVRLLSEDWDNVISHPFNRIPEAAVKTYNTATRTLLGLTPNGDGTYTANSTALLFFNNFVPGAGRALATGNALANQDITRANRTLRFLTGIRTFEVDAQKSKAFDRLKQLDEFIDQKGLPTTQKELRRVRMIEAMKRKQEGN